MKHKIHSVLYVLNIPRMICDHALGKDHSPKHRKAVGLVLFSFAFFIPNSFEVFFVHRAVDLFITSLHAIGLNPFIEHYDNKKCDLNNPN